MAELFDLFLRLFPSGAKADAARDILWHLPRRAPVPRHTHRAAALFNQSTSRPSNAALKPLLKSFKIRPTAPAAGAICEIFLQMGLTTQAIRYGYEAIRLDHAYADHRLHLACCLEAAGLHRSAALTLKEAESLCDTPYKALRLCSCAIQLNQFEISLNVSKKWRKKFPFSAEFLQMHLASLRANPSLWSQALPLLPLARTLDTEDLALQAYAAMDWNEEHHITDDQNKEQFGRLLCDGIERHLNADIPEEETLKRMLTIPLPGSSAVAAGMLLQMKNEVGMRAALLSNALPASMIPILVVELKRLHSSEPYLAHQEGHYFFLPEKDRPPYDADLHALIRSLLRLMRPYPPLDSIVHYVPAAWYSLSEGSRRYSSRSTDNLWAHAFAALVCCRSGTPDKAQSYIDQSCHPRRCARLFRRLLRRNHVLYEVH